MKSRILALTLIVVLTSTIVCAGDNACGVRTEENLGFAISPGESVGGFSILDGTISQGYYDILWFIVLGAGNLHLEVEDCCIMGDAMLANGQLLIGGSTSYMDWAISPDIISLDVGCPDFALGMMIMGYLVAPGGFPAGYDWRAELSGGCDIVGNWEVRYDWGCDGSYSTSMNYLYADGTFCNSEGSCGTWTLVGDQFKKVFDNGTTYWGTVAPSCTFMDGEMESSDGSLWGCWEADKTAVTSTEALEGDSLDEAGN